MKFQKKNYKCKTQKLSAISVKYIKNNKCVKSDMEKSHINYKYGDLNL